MPRRPAAVSDVDACLARIEAVEPRVHAFAYLYEMQAVRAAPAAPDGPLQGVAVGVKDILDTAGIPTERGSRLFAGRVPERSATAVTNLERAGAVVVGKTVTAELAYFDPGPTRNPWDLSRTPGGSSMGSAAAVAAGECELAVGTQTNGSIIRPAAFCGVVGFKPSYGAISREGVMTFSETLDHVGGFARSVDGVARLAAALAGQPDSRWRPTQLGRPPRLAVIRTSDWEMADEPMRAHFEADVARLAEAGAGITRPDLPGQLDDPHAVVRTLMAAEGFAALGAHVARRPGVVGARLRELLEEGGRITPERVSAARDRRDRDIAAFRAWIDGYDALLTPPARGEAPTPETTGDPRFCTRWTLVGAPAVTIPTGLGPSRLPLGLQVVGAIGEDQRALSVAAWAESILPSPGAPPL